MILLKIIPLAWFLATFSPWQDFLERYIKKRIPQSLGYLRVALSCFMCHSFWMTLAVTQDIFLAAGAAMIASTYDRIVGSLKTYL